VTYKLALLDVDISFSDKADYILRRDVRELLSKHNFTNFIEYSTDMVLHLRCYTCNYFERFIVDSSFENHIKSILLGDIRLSSIISHYSQSGLEDIISIKCSSFLFPLVT
jgi:hypothetical protein